MIKVVDAGINYTVKEIVKEIRDNQKLHDAKLDRIEMQVRKTNGRVTQLEKTGVGMWVSKNPLKFAIILIMVLSFLISDFRHPLINFITSFL